MVTLSHKFTTTLGSIKLDCMVRGLEVGGGGDLNFKVILYRSMVVMLLKFWRAMLILNP